MKEISLKDYTYILPEDRIAIFPAQPRDSAKLLVCEHGRISHTHFANLPDFLPEGSFLFFNNTKVIPARLFFNKSTGAVIEIFLLEPEAPHRIVALAMQQTGSCTWQCLIGNKKRWKNGEKLVHELSYEDNTLTLRAELTDTENSVRFTWNPTHLPWVEVVQHFGELPLPPYFKRKPAEADKQKYQTVYAQQDGAVAAPTAGLHFTENVLADLRKKGIGTDFLTLHVSAGTFQPVKTENALDHTMHAEQLVFSLENVKNVLKNHKNMVAVGTTSLRALESLYWFGIKLLTEKSPVFFIEKLFPYQFETARLPETKAVLQAILDFMEQHELKELLGETEIFIVPGYNFKLCRGLLTNYHLPETTLMLLVAAFVGEDWRKVYEAALANDYRFLSYGDSSLLLP